MMTPAISSLLSRSSYVLPSWSSLYNSTPESSEDSAWAEAREREYTTFSNHRTSCPWKGQARYHSLLVNGEMNPDAVWYYPDPSEAAQQIKGRVAFWKGVKVE